MEKVDLIHSGREADGKRRRERKDMKEMDNVKESLKRRRTRALRTDGGGEGRGFLWSPSEDLRRECRSSAERGNTVAHLPARVQTITKFKVAGETTGKGKSWTVSH